ncbi:hypothetical protein SVAN01_04361 [Stagonosporopsis vannaccii]|nr:hypothetical protein SVAN01_04361 [Stagonosporopsis vannaccii]
MAESIDAWECVGWNFDDTWGGNSQQSQHQVVEHGSALHKAAYEGDIAQLVSLLTEIDDVDILDRERCTPLHQAIRGNRAEAVRVLLSAGAQSGPLDLVDYCYEDFLAAVDSAAYFGANDALIALADYGLEVPFSALRHAALGNHIDCIRTILNRSTSSKLRDEALVTEVRIALFVAAGIHHRETVDLLLTHVPGFPDPTLKADRDSLTHTILALLSHWNYAAGRRHWERPDETHTLPILEQLVTAGAEVDSRAFWASAQNPVQSGITHFLLEHGLQVNDTRNWDQKHCRELFHQSRPMLFVIAADRMDSPFLTEEFLARGASAMTRDRKFDTPLHHVASCCIAKVLLEHGANIDARNREGHTPLYAACNEDRLDVAKMLLSRGADTRAINKDEHWLSLMSSAIERHLYNDDERHFYHYDDRRICDNDCRKSPRVELAEILIRHGANVQAGKNRILHMAVQASDAALVKCLIECGADVHDTDAAGRSVLHTICLYPWHPHGPTIVSLLTNLLDLGADPNARDESGDTPLHGLMSNPDNGEWKPPVCSALLERGADKNLRNDNGDLPADLLDRPRYLLDETGLRESCSRSSSRTGRGRGGRGRGRIPST